MIKSGSWDQHNKTFSCYILLITQKQLVVCLGMKTLDRCHRKDRIIHLAPGKFVWKLGGHLGR